MIYVVLPAYNEERALPLLLREMLATLGESRLEFAVIVVDDGSTDNTADVMRDVTLSPLVSMVRHPVNRRLSQALKTGLLEAQRKASAQDIIVTMDSDNTHPPGLILPMARMIREGSDVVIASRYQPGSRVIGVPLRRKVLSLGASFLFRVLFPLKDVKDYTSGYRAYRASLIQKMFQIHGDDFINRPGFSCTVDILLKMHRHSVKARGVPLVLHYDRKAGQSKMRVARTVLETLDLIKMRLSERS